MKKVATTLRSHKPLIMNWFKAKGLLSSGAVEGLNLKAKLTIRKAYGFKSVNACKWLISHTWRVTRTTVPSQILLKSL